MYEFALHYIWLKQLYDQTNLTATSGERVQVLHPGFRNHHAGPDFKNARLRIDDQLWIGDVEIHVKSSEWNQHKHQYDPLYNTTILHVVLREDVKIKRSDESQLICLELINRFPEQMEDQALKSLKQEGKILCAPFANQIPKEMFRELLHNKFLSRLNTAIEHLNAAEKSTKFGWEEILNRHIVKSFGMKVNKMPFEMLSEHIDFSLIARIHDQPTKLEAMLFGIAGFLEDDPQTSYQAQLKKEFLYLQKLHSLSKLPVEIWQFMRIRPSNFPTIRIGQLAAWLGNYPNPIRELKLAKNLAQLRKALFIQPNEFWKDHFTFRRVSPPKTRNPGRSFENSLLINGVLPALYADAIRNENEEKREMVLSMFQSIKPEKNEITQLYNAMHVRSRNATESQGMIELYRESCQPKLCNRCKIGRYLLNSIVNEAHEATRYSNLETPH